MCFVVRYVGPMVGWLVNGTGFGRNGSDIIEISRHIPGRTEEN